KVKVWGSIKGL
nr:Chain A, Superoxide dismutase [Cu-Zn] [Homo sapiens]5DLI_B Chain B, Superoxide dismutase [Cu-Zn] [Homo sapiens]5DLI_C Chain C, Superoxide dismutase [Cu-Zn] [Homo sapiens]5DLI_D Chain D, Superoxide dismutase [Cu-Zn] [Homo sapiens]5DLI_E Chain E, Superoxide dismutase [Cu-Zn] [Homo sapiens]5DLI_F Chain F, Superoxide dismutase [Cu-Zn] [Homo sapiens]5DLI_G Chain G, Superoxide dismutase [Cu-Zn] [Homo sapiens]5DLI_H Chain H, Superoxide dismutase [Cu-Zn] [Homo sapiens]5IIW_A Chain A, Superoxide 